jgi:hypothetical protein
MTASPFPASTPRARLWLAVIALTCCFTGYLIAAPLLYHGPAANWSLTADIVMAVAGAALLVMMWLLQRENTVATRLPAALDGSPVPAAKTDGIGEDLAELLERAVTAAAGARDRQESMRTAVVALSRRAQTSARRLQEEATLMANRHPGDADVLAVSMGVDHAAQQARHTQSMAVLCGEWPGQQWLKPLPLVDVVRAAAGRARAL